MTTRPKTVRWYNSRWTYLIVIVMIIIGAYFALKKTVTYFNLQEYQKTIIDSLQRENKYQDTLIDLTKSDISKLKKSIQKIDTDFETKRIDELERQIKQIRKIKVVRDTIPKNHTPESTLLFFNDLINKK